MNPLEQLQGQVAALSNRLNRVEAVLYSHRRSSADALEAAATASRLGLAGEPYDAAARAVLARELRGRAWSFGRIGRVLGKSERTAKRYARVFRDPKSNGHK